MIPEEVLGFSILQRAHTAHGICFQHAPHPRTFTWNPQIRYCSWSKKAQWVVQAPCRHLPSTVIISWWKRWSYTNIIQYIPYIVSFQGVYCTTCTKKMSGNGCKWCVQPPFFDGHCSFWMPRNFVQMRHDLCNRSWSLGILESMRHTAANMQLESGLERRIKFQTGWCGLGGGKPTQCAILGSAFPGEYVFNCFYTFWTHVIIIYIYYYRHLSIDYKIFPTTGVQ